ncbi:hypothetical protein NEUTE1DRAFT_112579 [Neurospora tetrasperma FGSC 2508]|uniref:Uncharacterized protein n=1 Tax=Neurospora tetrasperma (strain FGSC 2508 / ATCC MYA-4615 / P0657) TaxID=510951 RepID=F8MVW6_NEUT8|nr:uncharacterized protein NEUTE1DRAFT_112579 [Neurospora tetrasperma FGSC 2508]EGO54014.1 hypothetical protein NEUTE1DRAFT_112579 [Neurospora tetrasperma FGSC 2508]
MADGERTFTINADKNARPLDNNYSIDQLACILQLWCEDHQQDLELGCLMSRGIGLLNLYDNDDTRVDTGIEWIYSSNSGRATADEYTDHYEALRSPTVPSSPNSKPSPTYSLKVSDFSPSASIAERSAKKCHSRLSLDLQIPSAQPMDQTPTGGICSTSTAPNSNTEASTEDGADEPEGSYGAAVVVSPPPGGQPATLPTATAFETGASRCLHPFFATFVPPFFFAVGFSVLDPVCFVSRYLYLVRGDLLSGPDATMLRQSITLFSYAGNALILLGAHDEDKNFQLGMRLLSRAAASFLTLMRRRLVDGGLPTSVAAWPRAQYMKAGDWQTKGSREIFMNDGSAASFCEPSYPRQANSQH